MSHSMSMGGGGGSECKISVSFINYSMSSAVPDEKLDALELVHDRCMLPRIHVAHQDPGNVRCFMHRGGPSGGLS
jgi:hypothetical protein